MADRAAPRTAVFYAALRMRSIETAVPIAIAFMLVHLLRVEGQWT